jgi:phosphate transport system ATP-binding protein
MDNKLKISVNDLHFSYKDKSILDGATLRIMENTINAIIGPSGIGKSTFLTTLNRLWEATSEAEMAGKIEISFHGVPQDIYDPRFPETTLRRKVGMVFQTPNPLPMSIFRNVAFPLKLAGKTSRGETEERVEKALRQACLWDEVKDRLQKDALLLSGGQQQRLCIARTLVLEPEVLLLDEPTSSLDEKAGAVIEDLLVNLKKNCTIVMVSHYLAQVRRIADTVHELVGGKFVTGGR